MDQFKLCREIPIVGGCAGALSNNLSIAVVTQKNLTHAAVANKNQVHTVCWDQKFEWMIHNTIPARDISPGRNNRKVDVIQAKFCSVRNRSAPLLIICSVAGAAVCDIVSASIIYWLAVPEDGCNLWRYMKGVDSRTDKLFIGCHTGQVFELCVRSDSLDILRTLQHQKEPIADLATGPNSLVTVGILGTIVFYTFDRSAGGMNEEKVSLKNITNSGLAISCVVIFNRLLFCGTMTGQIVVFDPLEAVVLAEINAHSQPVSDLDVHESSARILSTSEDSFFRIWQIGDVRNGDISCVGSTVAENLPIVGGCFVSQCDNGILLAAYDHSVLYHYSRKD